MVNRLLLSEYDSDEWLVDYVYLYGLPIAQLWAYTEVNGEDTTTHFDVKWYHLDHLGTPQTMTNASKTEVWKAQYYPFGFISTERVAGGSTDVRFPGQHHDRSTDLHYNMYRYYRPDVGRYMTPDPIGIAGGLNLYSYAGQNPVMRTDFYGLEDHTSPWQLGWEWLTGSGERTRYFEKGDPLTEMLRRHSHIQDLRALAAARLRRCEKSFEDRADYSLGGIAGVPKYVADYSTLLTFGLTGNMAVTYLGSYNLSYRVTVADASLGTATISFHAWNYSTISSATHPPVIGYTKLWNEYVGQPLDEFFSTGPMSATKQVFDWSETLIYNPCKCR